MTFYFILNSLHTHTHTHTHAHTVTSTKYTDFLKAIILKLTLNQPKPVSGALDFEDQLKAEGFRKHINYYVQNIKNNTE